MTHATSFTEANVNRFFDNHAVFKGRHKFTPQDVYNLDDTGWITVHRPLKVIVEKGKRTVSQMTSAERGTLATFVATVGATEGCLTILKLL